MDMQPTSQQNETYHLNAEAVALIRRALDSWNDTYGTGNMSCAVYDTAWVSLVTKTVDDIQAGDGSWGNNKSFQIDGILNTAASLLALKRHAAEPSNIRHVPHDDLIRRINIATASLRSQLAVWRVSTTTHVGFVTPTPSVHLPHLVHPLGSPASSSVHL